MIETPKAINTLSPAEATTRLAEMDAALHPAAPENPATPTEAAALLAARNKDASWREKFLGGDVAARREFKKLTELAAKVDPVNAVMAGVLPPGDKVEMLQPGELPVRDVAAAVPMLRDAGLSDATIEQVLRDQPVSRREHELVRQLRAQRHSDPTWVRRLLNGDHQAKRESLLMSVILSADIEEGRK